MVDPKHDHTSPLTNLREAKDAQIAKRVGVSDPPGGRARIEETRMFDWDEGNIDKNLGHGVQDWEIEEACQDPRSRIIEYRLVKGEWRYVLLGRSETSGKYLRVVYTLRTATDGETLIRPISAVEMSAAQRRRYLRK